jgi:hypothetical protein
MACLLTQCGPTRQRGLTLPNSSMPGLGPGIHDPVASPLGVDFVDGRTKSGHERE